MATKTDLDSFRDPKLARELLDAIERLARGKNVNLMEVCGTHTVSIARYGLRSAMPEGVHLLSGPGCPVCVTSNHDIDTMIALARIPDVIVTTFGDMIRVPGSSTTLGAERAQGRDVRVVYSPLDALAIARENPTRPVIFLGVGFETTTPAIGATILTAHDEGLENFFVYSAHKRTPPAIMAIEDDPETQVNGFILPGHVSTITGLAPYRPLAERYHVPGVVSGFEPVDILSAIARLLAQIDEGQARIENAYERGVLDEGNVVAQRMIDRVFEPCDATWRGLGVIPGSGSAIRPEFADHDAARAFSPDIEPTVEPRGCRCGDVLRGVIAPDRCPLFGRACTAEHPVGPCMVSSEGSCAAYFRYQEHSR
jgi:hydrogenase expression/formation protein HypD